jgi:hypothetical protein
MTPGEVARRLGWYDGAGRADGPRVSRALGLRPYVCDGRYIRRQRIQGSNAAALCRALGCDPWEVEL